MTNDKIKRIEQLLNSTPHFQDMKIVIATAIASIATVAIIANAEYLELNKVLNKSEDAIELRLDQYDNQELTHSAPPTTPTPTDIETIARQYNIHAEHLQAMIMASDRLRDEPEVPAEYRSKIIMDPVNVGVLSYHLQTDDAFALEVAAERYQHILRHYDDPVIAIAAFYAGEESVEEALEKANKELTRLDQADAANGRFAHSIFRDEREERRREFNWLNYLEPWQQDAVYSTLQFIEADK